MHIRLQTLLPTSAAARYHNIRVYLQVQQWLAGCNMKETDWGWMTKDENVVTVMTFLPPAPDELFLVIRCNCTTTMMMMTDSQMHLSQAQSACRQCQGIGCSNSTAADISDEDDDDDDDDR